MASKYSRTAIAGCREILCLLMPGIFVPKGQVKRPLAIGIHKEICKRVKAAHPDYDVDLIKASVRHYVCGLSYQEALVFGAKRFDADGFPCGSVDEQAAGAATRFAKLMRDQFKGSRTRQIEELRKLDGADV